VCIVSALTCKGEEGLLVRGQARRGILVTCGAAACVCRLFDSSDPDCMQMRSP
jgi:hypothetical protein